MKKLSLDATNQFRDQGFKNVFLYDSPALRLINFNFRPGQVLPVHSHPAEGQLSIQVLSGAGWFLGEDDGETEAKAGDILICDISEPHGVRAETQMRVLVTIAPPF